MAQMASRISADSIDWEQHQVTDMAIGWFKASTTAQNASDGWFATVETTPTSVTSMEVVWMEKVSKKIRNATSAIAAADREFYKENCPLAMILVKVMTRDYTTAQATTKYYDGTLAFEYLGESGIRCRL